VPPKSVWDTVLDLVAMKMEILKIAKLIPSVVINVRNFLTNNNLVYIVYSYNLFCLCVAILISAQ